MEMTEIPGKHRPLQMIHGFDEWAGTADDAIRAKIRTLRDAGLGGAPVDFSARDCCMRSSQTWAAARSLPRIAWL